MKKLLPLLFAALCLHCAAFRVNAENVEQVLRGGDSISVKLSGVPAEEIPVVSNTYDISNSGTINLPYIGELHAAGMRPSQLQKAIESAYKSGEIFTHPTVQVTSSHESPTQVIFVSGEVKVPGRITMSPGMTIHDAMTSAGGPTDFGNLKKVKLTRNGVTRMLDLRKADNPDAQIPAEAGDKLHIPQ
jgi:protein involved in polysaccharide export with SLBB domain